MCKLGIAPETTLYRMHSGLVNQLLACHLVENGVEIETPEQSAEKVRDVRARLKGLQSRARTIKFDF